MLNTNLKHLEKQGQLDELLKDNENVMICCGRMGPMCIPVYDIMKILESKYPQVQMWDMDFDIPLSSNIKSLPECVSFMGLPLLFILKMVKW